MSTRNDEITNNLLMLLAFTLISVGAFFIGGINVLGSIIIIIGIIILIGIS